MKKINRFLLVSMLVSIAFNAFADGIPPSQWTPKEQASVQYIRDQYQKQGLPFTDDQAAIAIQNMRTKMAKFAAFAMTAQVLPAVGVLADRSTVQNPVNTAPVASAAISEEQIGQQFAALPPKNGPLDIEGRKDGFVVNGQPYVDPEGRITSYAFDVVSGAIGYAAVGPTNVEIKLMRAGSSAQPLLIATATQVGDGSWQIVTASGKTINGTGFTVLPDGVLVARDTAAFRYTPGKGILNIPVPNGYVLAAFQHGNVGAAGYVLLEKYHSPGEENSLIGNIRGIIGTIGMAKLEDYALMNMNNGQLVPFNVNVEGKQVTALSGCRRVSSVTSKCNQATSFDSLFDSDGAPNFFHYYWRIYWMNTPSGPVAVTLEDGTSHVFITDLNSGKKVLAFSRALGINGIVVKQNGEGTVAITANLAFNHEQIPDAVAFLQQGKDVKTVETTSGAAAQVVAPASGSAVLSTQ